jgi:DNA-binding FadR family transcriptional regulator
MPARSPAKTPGPTRKRAHALHARLAQEIGGRILGGTYAPGTLLPNEAEWGRMFGASRTAIREAIKTLIGKGLLISRPKIGSRVEPRDRWNLLDPDVLAWHCAAMDQRAFLESTQEARRLIEPGIAALAAVKHSPEQLARLKEAYAGMAAARTGGERVEPDIRFHRALLACANNDLLAPFGIIFEQTMGNLFSYTTRHNPRPEFIMPLHEAVLKAVIQRSPQRARRAMQNLLDDTDAIVAAGPTKAKRVRKG